MIDLGIVRPGATLRIPFSSFDKDDGSAITMTNFAAADILVYKDGSTTERASTAGFTATTDFDSKTGKHLAIIDLADNTTSGFFAAGSEYLVALDAVTVDGVTVGAWIARFRIGQRAAVLDTTIASLSSQTSFTLASGPAEDDALNGQWAIVHDVASAVQFAWVQVLDYVGSTKTVTLVAAPTFTIASPDNFSLMGPMPLQPATLGRTLAVGTAGQGDSNVTQFGGTNATTSGGRPEVNTTHAAGTAWGSGAITSGALASGALTAIAAAVWNALTSGLTTVGSIGKLLVDNINATIGSRATQTSVDTLAGYVDTEVGAIKAKTDNLPSAPAATSDIPSASTIAAAVWDRLTSALTTVGSIGKLLVDNVNATISSRLASASYTAPLDAAGVQAAVGLASPDLDTQLAAIAGDAGGAKTAAEAAENYFVEMTEDDGGVPRFTTNALEQAPSGGGGSADWTADERTAIRAILGVPASGTTPDDPTTGILDTIRDRAVAVEADTQDIQSRLPAALVSGRMPADAIAISGSTAAADAVEANIGNLDAAVSSRLATAGYTAPPSAATIAAAVWDYLTSAATTVGSLGKLLVDNLNAAITTRLASASYTAPLDAAGVQAAVGLASPNLDTQLGAIDTAATAAQTAAEAVDGALTELTEDDGGGNLRYTTKALEQGPSGGGGGTADWTTDERTAIRSILGIPVSGTAPTDPSTGILDTIRDSVATRATQTSVDDLPTNAELATALASADDATLAAIATVSGKIGTPANLGSGATLADNLVDVEAQTDDLGTAGAGLTAIPWNQAWDAEVQSEAADALTAYDAPTRAEATSDKDEILTRLGTPAGASVSADVADVESKVDDLEGRLTATRAGYLDNLSGGAVAQQASVDSLEASAAAIEADTQDLQSRLPAALVGGRIDATVDGVGLEAAAVDAILDEPIGDGAITMRQALRVLVAGMAGKLSGASTTTVTVRNVADSADVIVATVDSDGNRAAVTVTP